MSALSTFSTHLPRFIQTITSLRTAGIPDSIPVSITFIAQKKTHKHSIPLKHNFAHIPVLEIKKKDPGCPYFKSRATKPVNLVALMNPWLPVTKTYTFKCTTKKNIHFCLLSALNYMLRSLVFPCLLHAVLVFSFLSRTMHLSRSI